MLKGQISRAVVLASACLLALAPFLWHGIPSGHDFEFHVFSWMEVLGQWKHGIVYPRWAALAHFGYGEARFLFYPPASWTLGAALGTVLPWSAVPAAYCWIVLMLAGGAMYRLARVWLRPADALFAAVFYALNPYHLLIIYWRSAYAELLAAALLPLLLLYLLRLQEPVGEESDQPTFRPVLCLSLVLAAAWLTNAPAAVMIHYSTAGLALLLAVREAAHEGSPERSRVVRIARPLVWTAGAILLGAGLASLYLVPAIYEQGWIDINQVMAPGVRPQDNFLFTTIPDPDHNRFNLLVSLVAVSEIGVLALAVWFSRRSKANRKQHSFTQHPWLPVSAWGVATALFMFSVTAVFWHHLPKFRFVQLPFRWLLCMNAALAILLTMAAKRWTSRLLACALLLAALMVAGQRTQPPWWDTRADLREMSDALADGTGYEGTDEYVPAGADAYELNKNLPLVSDDVGAAISTRVLAWGPVKKHFIVHAPAKKDLTVRLFSYPAWDVVVNGKSVETQKTEVTGLIVIPVAAGDNDVEVFFRRTSDRLAGGIVSLISLVLFVVLWTNPVWATNLLSSMRLLDTHSASHDLRQQASVEKAGSHVV